MKRVAAILLLTALTLVTGCDPGFTVRQMNGRIQSHPDVPATLQRVRVEVDRFHALIGVSLYKPKIRITNATELPIAVTGCELVTVRGVYPTSRHNEAYPITVAPSATEEIEVWFDLREGLYTTFKRPAELRVRYMIGNSSQAASARLAGKVQAAGEP